jgi:predicted MFS family arabinose efflux permease
MATATGLSVAGNYFAQPLLDVMSRDLDLGTTLAGLIVTAAQAGYALGLMLLVPLGDIVARRRLGVGLFAATAVFLLLTATAANGTMLLIGTVLAALSSVGAQVIVPFAVTLAEPADRGRVVGVVMAGIILGGLLARTVSGALSELGGWRTVYWVNAALMVAMALLLRSRLPRLPRPPAGDRPALRYPALLRSTFGLLRTEPVLRRRAALGALAQASYSVQLTVLTFLLVGRPYGWSEAAIGLFGLIGGVGLLVMPAVGRLTDRGHVQKVSGAGTVLLALAWLVLLGGAHSLPVLALGIVALNLAIQAVLISSQSVIYALRPEARNRINSAFMTC